MMRCLSLLFVLIFVSFPSQAQEANPPTDSVKSVKIPDVSFKTLKHTKSGRIDKIIDGLTLLLKDGTIVRLSSINSPDFHIWEQAQYSEQSLKLLKEMLPRQTEVMLYQTRTPKRGRVNRLNHALAHVVTKDKKQWMQGELLARGLVRVQTTPKVTDMLDEMYDIENEARQVKLGIWAEGSDYKLRSVNNLDDFIGEYAVIEGVVQKVASVRNDIYLNFGKNWKTDFTIMVPSGMRKEFAKLGYNIMTVANTRVRVRGELRSYNGPLIELDNVAHLEILKPQENNSAENDVTND